VLVEGKRLRYSDLDSILLLVEDLYCLLILHSDVVEHQCEAMKRIAPQSRVRSVLHYWLSDDDVFARVLDLPEPGAWGLLFQVC